MAVAAGGAKDIWVCRSNLLVGGSAVLIDSHNINGSVFKLVDRSPFLGESIFAAAAAIV